MKTRGDHERGVHVPHQDISKMHLALASAFMPFLSHMLGVRVSGFPEVWFFQGILACGEAAYEMPSISSRRI